MRDSAKPQQIIDAAIRVFARTGYYNSRVSDIAREAGIASGTIYLYFPTKDEILVTLFREKMAQWVALVRREIATERRAITLVSHPGTITDTTGTVSCSCRSGRATEVAVLHATTTIFTPRRSR